MSTIVYRQTDQVRISKVMTEASCLLSSQDSFILRVYFFKDLQLILLLTLHCYFVLHIKTVYM